MKIINPKYISLALIILGISYILYTNMTTRDTISRSDIKYLPHELTGKRNSDFMIVFLHGFPNTMRMWDNMIKDFEREYYCLNISYPNYSKKMQVKWGLDLDDIVDLIKATIDHVEETTAGDKKYKKILISHDWGSFFAYLLNQKYENYITDNVTMDVGPGIEETNSAKLFTLAYQSYLATNFLIGGPIGKYMTRLFVKFANPYGLTKEDMERVDSSWNYPYYYMWRHILHYKKELEKFEIKAPIAYLYATQKPFNFHNEKFMNQIKQCAKCEAHAIDSDHWIMRNPEHSKFIIDLIRRRMKYFK